MLIYRSLSLLSKGCPLNPMLNLSCCLPESSTVIFLKYPPRQGSKPPSYWASSWRHTCYCAFYLNFSTAHISFPWAKTVRKYYIFWADTQEFAAFVSCAHFTLGTGHPEDGTRGIRPLDLVYFSFLNLQGFVLLFPFSSMGDHIFFPIWCFSKRRITSRILQ